MKVPSPLVIALQPSTRAREESIGPVWRGIGTKYFEWVTYENNKHLAYPATLTPLAGPGGQRTYGVGWGPKICFPFILEMKIVIPLDG